jgi:hypothetical protein
MKWAPSPTLPFFRVAIYRHVFFFAVPLAGRFLFDYMAVGKRKGWSIFLISWFDFSDTPIHGLRFHDAI